MTTDEHSRDLIEAERMDVPQMISRVSYWRGWCIDHETEDKELERLRYLLDAVLLHLYDVRDGVAEHPLGTAHASNVDRVGTHWEGVGPMNDDLIEKADVLYDAIGTSIFREEFREWYRSVFEEAHHSTSLNISDAHSPSVMTSDAPTDDERTAIVDALLDELGWEWDEVPEEHIPSSRAILGDMADRVLAVAAGFRRPVSPEPQGELTIRDHVRALTGVSDEVLDELGGFQGEPTDAMILAGLNAENPRAATDDLSDWGDWSINRMRAALRAASSVHGENR